MGGMVETIVSFGCSFVLGMEIQNNPDGSRAWPALAAKNLGVDYVTCAQGGCGNEQIARQIYDYFSRTDHQHTLAVINWTWCMRWDFYLVESQCWHSIGPTCADNKFDDLIGAAASQQIADFYKFYAGRSDVWNIFRSLQAVYAAQCWLEAKGIPAIQTYMDRSMIEQVPTNPVEHYQAYKDPSWPDITAEADLDDLPDHIRQEVQADFGKDIMPSHVKCLQQMVTPRLSTWQGQTFLEWSESHGFPITAVLHPLEQAHEAAADHWIDRYAAALGMHHG